MEATVADLDDDDLLDPGVEGGLYRIHHERDIQDLVKYFGSRALHSSALSGGQDNRCRTI